MSNTVLAPSEVTVDQRSLRRIAASAFAGTALEWYDFFLFSTASAIVFHHLFFSHASSTASRLASFATFGVGFLARPLGAILFGQLGDRLGRRPALILSIVTVGAATGLVGALPTYASAGILAPALLTLLRLVQGVAVGGEWGGATTMAIEHAPAELRGRYAAVVQLGSPAGTLLSSGAFALVFLLWPNSVDTFAWRIPFLAAFPLLFVALWIRMHVEESPVFEQLVAVDDAPRATISELFRVSKRQLALATATTLLGIGGYFLMNTYVMSYATTTFGMSRQVVVNATLLAACVQVLVIVTSGRLTHRFRAGHIAGWGALATAALAWPLWVLIDTGQPWAVTTAICVGICVLTVPYAVSGIIVAELFPPATRYSGIDIGANIAGAISGCLPFAATALGASTGAGEGHASSLPAIVILVGISLATAVGGFVGEQFREPDAITVRT